MTQEEFNRNTRAELTYLMQYHNLPEMWIYAQVGRRKEIVGKVVLTDGDLSYNCEHCWRYLEKADTAYLYAEQQIFDYLDMVRRFKSDEKVSRVAVYTKERDVWEYADEDGVVRHHTFPKKQRTEREETFVGTLDEIFVQMEGANRRLRYCNGSSWKFKDEDAVLEYLIWSKWIPYSRSMDLYYGNGIVD